MNFYVMFNNAMMDPDATRERQQTNLKCITEVHVSGMADHERFFIGATISANEDGGHFRFFWTIRDTVTGAVWDGYTPDGAVTLRRGETILNAVHRAQSCADEQMTAQHYNLWARLEDSRKSRKFAEMMDYNRRYGVVRNAMAEAFGEAAYRLVQFYGE